MLDCNLLAIDPKTRRVTFALNRVPKKTERMPLVLQLCIKTILTTPGSDIFSPEFGGGLIAFSKNSFSIQDIPRINLDLAYIVREAERQVIKEQSNKNIKASEKLESLTFLGSKWIEEDECLSAQVIVKTAAGEVSAVDFANQLRFGR